MASLKSKLKGDTVGTAVVMTLPTLKGRGASELNKLIEAAIRGAKNVVQSITAVEPLIAKAANATLDHFAKHGDAMPADRLVKGLILLNHPASTAMARELMAWYRPISNIRWDSKHPFKVKVLKDGDEGYSDKEPDVAKGEETPFNETKQAKSARSMAEKAHANALKPADLSMMVGRAAGTIAFLNNILTGKDERKIKPGEQPKMERFAKALNGVLKDFGGEEAAVPLVKAKKAA